MSSDRSSVLLSPPSSRPDVPGLREQVTNRYHAIGGGLIAVLVFAACFWMAWPIAEMGFDDDWSYIKTTQIFAQTGHLVYNGWASPMLGWQIPWGALFIRLFGFSFTAVKLSTFPLAIGCLLLFYAIQIRFGIHVRNAVLGTLTLGLSPLFMPLAASYMTDVPGLLIILLCLYCCQRALAASTNATTIAWLCFAAAASVAGGTARQIAWLGALVMVPCTGWLVRERRGVIPTILTLWTASLCCVLYLMHWFARQPYSVPAPLLPSTKLRPVALILVVAIEMIGEVLCLLLVVYPVLVPWIAQTRKLSRYALILMAFVLLVWTDVQWSLGWTLPWVRNLIGSEFSASRVPGLMGGPFILNEPACLIFSSLVMAALLAFLAMVYIKLRGPENPSTQAPLHEILLLFGPFTLCYLALLLPHASDGLAFDRYMLNLMPFAIICFIQLYQLWIGPNLPMSSVLTLALYALLAIAGTHDWFASQRARLTAIREVRASGIPETEIGGGTEYDDWTQIEKGGYINNPRIKTPPDAYRPNKALRVLNGCELDSDFLPDLHPIYFVAPDPRGCLVASKFAPVQFRTWLPPFHGTFYVQEVPAAKR